MNKNLQKSKYDEQGRPIKKSVFVIADIDLIEGRKSEKKKIESSYKKSKYYNDKKDTENDNFDQEHFRLSIHKTGSGFNILFVGLISFLFSFFGFFFAIAGIIMAIRTDQKSLLRTIGLSLCILSLLLTLVSILRIVMNF